VTGISGPVLRPIILIPVLAVLLVLAFTCAWSSASAGAAPSKAGVKRTCQVVAATLTDGPDPGADPVGYALAQVLPLRQIKTSDEPLKKSIDQLSSAYETFYKDGGTKTAKTLVARATESVDAYCPGAAS